MAIRVETSTAGTLLAWDTALNILTLLFMNDDTSLLVGMKNAGIDKDKNLPINEADHTKYHAELETLWKAKGLIAQDAEPAYSALANHRHMWHQDGLLEMGGNMYAKRLISKATFKWLVDNA